jgi:hypothetical protein
MMEHLAYNSAPAVFLVFAVILNIVCFELGRVFGKRSPAGEHPRAEAAFSIAQTAIFGLGGLILAFSFSFAAARFETRRTFVTQEANAIGTTYLRADYLPAPESTRFRSVLKNYAKLRLLMYAWSPDQSSRSRAEQQSIALQDLLWGIAVKAGRADPRNVQLGLLTQTLNETIDMSASQSALLKTHLPLPVVALIVLVSVLVAMLVGVSFGRAGTVQPVTSIVLCIVFGVVIYTIVDLDRPQRGFIRTNLTPLQTQLDAMR